MTNTFRDCTNLTTAPVIPSNVKYIKGTFQSCTSLTGTVIINATNPDYASCFWNTVQPIVLTGSSTVLAELAATADNGNVTVQQ
jgi:hypothetical protein